MHIIILIKFYVDALIRGFCRRAHRHLIPNKIFKYLLEAHMLLFFIIIIMRPPSRLLYTYVYVSNPLAKCPYNTTFLRCLYTIYINKYLVIFSHHFHFKNRARSPQFFSKTELFPWLLVSNT